ncbi:unnamed protein product, partial [Prorocentrum cordatum]
MGNELSQILDEFSVDQQIRGTLEQKGHFKLRQLVESVDDIKDWTGILASMNPPITDGQRAAAVRRTYGTATLRGEERARRSKDKPGEEMDAPIDPVTRRTLIKARNERHRFLLQLARQPSDSLHGHFNWKTERGKYAVINLAKVSCHFEVVPGIAFSLGAHCHLPDTGGSKSLSVAQWLLNVRILYNGYSVVGIMGCLNKAKEGVLRCSWPLVSRFVGALVDLATTDGPGATVRPNVGALHLAERQFRARIVEFLTQAPAGQPISFDGAIQTALIETQSFFRFAAPAAAPTPAATGGGRGGGQPPKRRRTSPDGGGESRPRPRLARYNAIGDLICPDCNAVGSAPRMYKHKHTSQKAARAAGLAVYAGRQPRACSVGHLVPDLPRAAFIECVLTQVSHPLARPCSSAARLPQRVQLAAWLGKAVAQHRWELDSALWRKQAESAASYASWRAGPAADQESLRRRWSAPLFRRLLEEAEYEDMGVPRNLLEGMPVAGLASDSGARLLKTAAPAMRGPAGDPELDERACEKTCARFKLNLMEGPFDTLEARPGTGKVFVRRKPRWRDNDARNIDDCSRNNINATFGSKETYRPAGIDHHASVARLWEALCPGAVLKDLVADLWKHVWQVLVGLNLVVVLGCTRAKRARFGRIRGSPFGAAARAQTCARLPVAVRALLQHHLLIPAQHYQDDHHCVEPGYSAAQARFLSKLFHEMVGPELAEPGGPMFTPPTPQFKQLGICSDLAASPREVCVLPARVEAICVELRAVRGAGRPSSGLAAELHGKW